MKKLSITATSVLAAFFSLAAIGQAQTQDREQFVKRPKAPAQKVQLARQEIDVQACTSEPDPKDNRRAWFLGFFDQKYLADHPDFEQKVKDAFVETANSMSAYDLLMPGGADAFFNHFDDEEYWVLYEAITNASPPSVGTPGSCKFVNKPPYTVR